MHSSTQQFVRAMDAVFRSHDVGEICLELMARCVDICDKAYPDLMKALWA